MNWHVEGDELRVEHAEGENTEPDKQLVTAARRAATSLAKKLGGECHVEVHGHETTVGKGFRPGHVTLSVSRLDPKR